ncbi:UNVERIFIED_CONTAM: protein ENDOSPERM defective [Sesamum radiatum]|uniref:Protein ENDOSPERM defective n=1 Tax=Sesamum radiatum TaxID=300843 RepID=A0AAW2K2Y1_SESRA
MAEAGGGGAADSTTEHPAPPPPLTQRRPRVREVSSRFMSPLIQSNSTPNPSNFPRSKTVHRRQPSKTDENHIPETNRSLDKLSASIFSTIQRKQSHQRVKQHAKENGEPRDHQHPEARVSSRPDTPIAMGTDRIVGSRYRQVPNSIYRSNSLNSSSNGCAAVTAAARLLQEATSDVEKKLSRISTSSRDDMDSCSTTSSNQGSSSCPNSPLCMPINKLRSVPDTRSSMPDVDKWLAERNSSNAGRITSDCARSLNFSSSLKTGGGISLPPHPSSCIRSGLDVKKGKKVISHQEDVHSLKMLSNHYLQWRFANAKAEASMHVQTQEAERKFYSLGNKLSDLRDRRKRKRNELAVLRRIHTLTTIVEAQMPYLDEWTTLEEDYSTSLLGTTNALLSSSDFPWGSAGKADTAELGEALGAALKAEEMDKSVSELAKVAGRERVLFEDCGYLLSKTYTSQVKECSLRSSLIQIHSSNKNQKQKCEES